MYRFHKSHANQYFLYTQLIRNKYKYITAFMIILSTMHIIGQNFQKGINIF